MSSPYNTTPGEVSFRNWERDRIERQYREYQIWKDWVRIRHSLGLDIYIIPEYCKDVAKYWLESEGYLKYNNVNDSERQVNEKDRSISN